MKKVIVAFLIVCTLCLGLTWYYFGEVIAIEANSAIMTYKDKGETLQYEIKDTDILGDLMAPILAETYYKQPEKIDANLYISEYCIKFEKIEPNLPRDVQTYTLLLNTDPDLINFGSHVNKDRVIVKDGNRVYTVNLEEAQVNAIMHVLEENNLLQYKN